VGGLFSLETISFVVQKVFNFMKSHLSILSLSYWDDEVLLRKSLPIPISSRVFPVPSSSNFRVSGLILRSLIHFELILVQGDRHGSSFSFLQMRTTYFPPTISCNFYLALIFSASTPKMPAMHRPPRQRLYINVREVSSYFRSSRFSPA
jgi:hypothetical protein